ncbi:MAG: hypothetical protein HC817_14270 [Saprospiraceae bacterium]|nr:hypothetical protein [Saprospiraceae bacterium]
MESQFPMLEKSKDVISINSTRFHTGLVKYYTNAHLPNFKPIESFSVGDITVPLENNGVSLRYIPELAKFFGKKTTVSINFADKNDLSLKSEAILEIPPPIEIIDDTPNSNNFIRGDALRWVAGNQNDDIFIAISFNNSSFLNEEFETAPSVYRYKLVKDIGITILTASDFSGIPSGAYVEVNVTRAKAVIAGGTTNGSGASAVVSSISSATVGGTLN